MAIEYRSVDKKRAQKMLSAILILNNLYSSSENYQNANLINLIKVIHFQFLNPQLKIIAAPK